MQFTIARRINIEELLAVYTLCSPGRFDSFEDEININGVRPLLLLIKFHV